MSSYVDVNDFGAIGEPLLNHGSIGANLTQLKLDDPGQGETLLSAWKEGTGIAIAGAGRGGIHPHVTRIAKNGIIDDHNFILETPAIHDVQGASVTNDDSLPIQAAIDSLGTRGGTVSIPAGTYRIGTTGRPLTFADSNQPLFISSNMRIIGAGLGATVLVLPNDVRQRQKWFPDEPQCQHLDASIFVNRANGFVHLPEARPAPDARLEVAHMTLDGNKGGQSFLFGRDNTTDPRIGDPPPSALTADLGPDVIQPPPNALVWSKGYAFAVSYMGDNPERETLASGYYFFKIPDQDQHQGSPSVRLRLPPTPQGAKTVVVYAATDDPNPCLGNPFREYHDQHYERQPPVPVPEPDPVDTMNRPTLLIDHHAPPPEPAFFPRGVLTQFPGESSLSMALALDNAADCYLHDLEIRNFVTDGLELSYVRDSLFEAIWSHDNGRHGVGSAGQASSLRFVDCRLEDNASTGCDLEGQGFQDIHFLNCSFKENGTGLSLGPAPPDANSPSMFNNVAIMNCDFDHNLQHVFTVAAPNTTPITNLRLIDCTFRYSLRVAVFVGAPAMAWLRAATSIKMGDHPVNRRTITGPPSFGRSSPFSILPATGELSGTASDRLSQ